MKEEKSRSAIQENTLEEQDTVFEPWEVIAIAFGGAEKFLAEEPNLSEEKIAALHEIIEKERQERTEKLKTIMRRYTVALNQAMIFQARNEDDSSILLQRCPPTIDEPGFVKLSADKLHFKMVSLLKAIGGASFVDIKTIEVEERDEKTSRPEITLWFSVL